MRLNPLCCKKKHLSFLHDAHGIIPYKTLAALTQITSNMKKKKKKILKNCEKKMLNLQEDYHFFKMKIQN